MEYNNNRGFMIKWYNPLDNGPILITGFLDKKHFARINLVDAVAVIKENKCLETLISHTSGGMIRFITDSANLVIKAKVGNITPIYNLSINALSSFDIYISKPGKNDFKFLNVTKTINNSNFIEFELFNNLFGLKEVLINFPLFNQVDEVLIGVRANNQVLPPTPFADNKKIVFYGTSITQGASASRPGNTYVNTISRDLNIEVLNLGFSGNGLGEKSMIKVISEINDMKLLIIDYDANAGSTGSLYLTLKPFIASVRKNHPIMPIIVISRIPYILESFKKEIAQGINKRRSFQKNLVSEADDVNLYYLDGRKLLPNRMFDCFADDVHLNDLGFYFFSLKLKRIIKSII